MLRSVSSRGSGAWRALAGSMGPVAVVPRESIRALSSGPSAFSAGWTPSILSSSSALMRASLAGRTGAALGAARRSLASGARRPDRDAGLPPHNERIRLPEVLVVTEEGERLGVMTPAEGLKRARESGKDLVLVAPGAKPPVARIMSVVSLKQQQKKKEASQRKLQRRTKLKEMRFTSRTDDHDISVKADRVVEFLEAGHPVRVTISFVAGTGFRLQEPGRRRVLRAIVEQVGRRGYCPPEGVKASGWHLVASFQPVAAATNAAKPDEEHFAVYDLLTRPVMPALDADGKPVGGGGPDDADGADKSGSEGTESDGLSDGLSDDNDDLEGEEDDDVASAGVAEPVALIAPGGRGGSGAGKPSPPRAAGSGKPGASGAPSSPAPARAGAGGGRPNAPPFASSTRSSTPSGPGAPARNNAGSGAPVGASSGSRPRPGSAASASGSSFPRRNDAGGANNNTGSHNNNQSSGGGRGSVGKPTGASSRLAAFDPRGDEDEEDDDHDEDEDEDAGELLSGHRGGARAPSGRPGGGHRGGAVFSGGRTSSGGGNGAGAGAGAGVGGGAGAGGSRFRGGSASPSRFDDFDEMAEEPARGRGGGGGGGAGRGGGRGGGRPLPEIEEDEDRGERSVRVEDLVGEIEGEIAAEEAGGARGRGGSGAGAASASRVVVQGARKEPLPVTREKDLRKQAARRDVKDARMEARGLKRPEPESEDEASFDIDSGTSRRRKGRGD